MAKKYKNFEEARAALIARAWKDPAFKAKLLKNPRAAFKEMGIDIPEKMEVRVMEEKANTLTFILPRSALNVGELPEKELNQIAGGTCQRTGRVNISAQMSAKFQETPGACDYMVGSSAPE